jgi:hypothetical protein
MVIALDFRVNDDTANPKMYDNADGKQRPETYRQASITAEPQC